VQDAIVVPVGDQKAAAVRFDCVLETRWNIELRGGRIGDRERADIGNEGVAVTSRCRPP
jgi:hypothetical protein